MLLISVLKREGKWAELMAKLSSITFGDWCNTLIDLFVIFFLPFLLYLLFLLAIVTAMEGFNLDSTKPRTPKRTNDTKTKT
jgi:hypothetical protein